MIRIFILSCLVMLSTITSANAQKSTFLSLSKDQGNMRYGPSKDHPIKWVYTKRGWPFEVKARFEQWVKVRDISGEEGWIHNSLLSSRMYGVVIPNEEKNYVILRKKKVSESAGLLRLEEGALVRVLACEGGSCKVSISGYKGFLEKKVLWGIVQK